ncbi:hypothetical protein RSAG8_03287, partial [Rhizoctonia solani AG-8 WAC10335]
MSPASRPAIGGGSPVLGSEEGGGTGRSESAGGMASVGKDPGKWTDTDETVLGILDCSGV